MKSLRQELEDIIKSSSFTDIENDLDAEGWDCPIEIETNDDLPDHTDEVIWDSMFEVSKNDVTFEVSLEGTAIADISYERWVDTYGYSIDDFFISEIE